MTPTPSEATPPAPTVEPWRTEEPHTHCFHARELNREFRVEYEQCCRCDATPCEELMGSGTRSDPLLACGDEGHLCPTCSEAKP